MVTTLLAARLVRGVPGSLARAGSVTMRDIVSTRRYWAVVVSGFFEPVLYLLSIGVGVGGLVHNFQLADGRVVSYASFVAPAMLAASAMNGALAETANNFFGKLKWAKLYDGMVATPLRPFEVALGELTWALMRGTIYSIAFLALMVGLDLTTALRTIPAFVASVLIGFSFGALGMAVSTFMRTWQDFDYTNVVIFAMFLFSGTFVPAQSYPVAMRAVVALTPLYHGVELVRGFTTGAIGWSMLGNVAYLVTLAVVGLTIASRRMTRLLCP
ncbi:MAG TPA: ABC transporter permease [Micromonosporaceae bacterium]|jgi:lipooligosaccharide transport system permease protein